MLSFSECFLRHRMWLPRFLVIAVFLSVPDRLAKCDSLVMPDCKQGDLIVKIDKAFNDHTSSSRSSSLLRILPCFFNFGFAFNNTLALAGRAHYRFDNT